MKKTSGFTLIELLVVVTIIATLAVAVFVALNPAKRLLDAKNARRAADVPSILTAIHTSVVDNGGLYPTKLDPATLPNNEVRQIGTGVAGCALALGGNCTTTGVNGAVCLDLMVVADARNLIPYLKSMPIDPTGGTTWTAARTGYTVVRDANGIVTISACGTESTPFVPISSSR